MKVWGQKFWLASFSALTIAALPFSFASAQDVESDLKPEPKAEYKVNRKLVNQYDEKSVDTDLEAADVSGYKGAAAQAKADEVRLKAEIRKLEKQVVVLKEGAKQAKEEAQLAFKRLELQQKQNAEARVQVAAAQKEKNKADAERAKVAEQLKVAQNETEFLRSKSKVLAGLIKEDEDAMAQMREKIQKEHAAAVEEKDRLKDLAAKRARMQKQAQTQARAQ